MKLKFSSGRRGPCDSDCGGGRGIRQRRDERGTVLGSIIVGECRRDGVAAQNKNRKGGGQDDRRLIDRSIDRGAGVVFSFLGVCAERKNGRVGGGQN